MLGTEPGDSLPCSLPALAAEHAPHKNAEIMFTQLRYCFLHKTNTINSSPGLHGGSGSTSPCSSSIIHQGMKAGLEDCCLSKHRSSARYGTPLARRSPSVVAQHPAKQQRGSEEHPGVK